MMEFKSVNAIFDNEVKILKLNPLMLYVRVFDEATRQPINCIVAKHALTFFYKLQNNSRVSLYGHYNSRKQFVINKFIIQANVNYIAI